MLEVERGQERLTNGRARRGAAGQSARNPSGAVDRRHPESGSTRSGVGRDDLRGPPRLVEGRIDEGSGFPPPAAASPAPAPPESSGSYRASGGRLQGCPRGVSDPGWPRRSSNAARAPTASANAAPFARPVALHCGKPVWSWRRGTRGGGRRVRPATARRACRPPSPGRPRRPRRPSAGRRPEPPDAVGLGAVSRSRLNRRAHGMDRQNRQTWIAATAVILTVVGTTWWKWCIWRIAGGSGSPMGRLPRSHASPRGRSTG